MVIKLETNLSLDWKRLSFTTPKNLLRVISLNRSEFSNLVNSGNPVFLAIAPNAIIVLALLTFASSNVSAKIYSCW